MQLQVNCITEVGRFENLKRLSLQVFRNPTPPIIDAICSLTTLKELELSHMIRLDRRATKSELCIAADQLQKLTSLRRFAYRGFSNPSLTFLRNSTWLESIDLSHNR